MRRRSGDDHVGVPESREAIVTGLLYLAYADIEEARAYALFDWITTRKSGDQSIEAVRRAVQDVQAEWERMLKPLPERPNELWYAAHDDNRGNLVLSEPVATVEDVAAILNSDRRRYRENLAVVERGGIRWLARGSRSAAGTYQFMVRDVVENVIEGNSPSPVHSS